MKREESEVEKIPPQHFLAKIEIPFKSFYRDFELSLRGYQLQDFKCQTRNLTSDDKV